MNVCILSGGQRKKSNSLKVADYISSQLNKFEIQPQILDMNSVEVDIWSEEFWVQNSNENKQWQTISNQLKQTDAFIIIAPEYAGMVPPRLKNFLLKCNGTEVGNKPVLLIGISSGRGGTYPLIELRSNAFKNNFMCVIPQSVIVRKVDECFNLEIPENDNDEVSRNLIAYSLKHLVAYADALKTVREKSISDYKLYPYGV